MPSVTVNATRMELTRLKNRLKTAVRGHKLLKDNRQSLLNGSILLKALTDVRAHGSFTVASALMSPEGLEQALLYPKQRVELDMTTRNIMSVPVPMYTFRTKECKGKELYPYGFAMTSCEIDGAVEALSSVFQDMLKLAQVEKTSQLLAQEIEKTRRRVNALEYVMIPRMQESIKYIRMKLEENERNNIVRLMKVKDMLLAEALEEKRRQDQKIVQHL